MGYWTQNEQGHSFEHAAGTSEDTTKEMFWGDEPADAIGEALDLVDAAFQKQFHRLPTLAEIRAGLEFSLGGLALDGRSN